MNDKTWLTCYQITFEDLHIIIEEINWPCFAKEKCLGSGLNFKEKVYIC